MSIDDHDGVSSAGLWAAPRTSANARFISSSSRRACLIVPTTRTPPATSRPIKPPSRIARAMSYPSPAALEAHILIGVEPPRRQEDPGGREMAEGVGFEPTVPGGTMVFETIRFGRSRIPPAGQC